MRVGAIDVGTNSVRLIVCDQEPSGIRAIDRRLVITRLGQGVDKRRAFAPDALKRTLEAIVEYAAVCGDYGVADIRVTATSAARDARDRDSFFDAVRKLTGKPAELLSGEDEARLTFMGAVSDLPEGDPILVVDIGGGSTELVVGSKVPENLVSLDIGSVRSFEKHLSSDPPASEELDSLRAEVNAALLKARDRLSIPPRARLIGVAGTVTQLAALKIGLAAYDPDATHHSVLSHGDVRMLARRLASMPYEKRARIKGLVPGRADVIVSGAEILLSVMEVFDFAEVLVSERDLLDGIAIELLASDAGSLPK
ncbi:MAG: exopolyphosphatase [Actinomycetota bacterium]